MKNLVTLLILCIFPFFGYSQGDKFESAIIQLKTINYNVTNKDLNNNKHYRTSDKSEITWINESIDYCNTLDWIDRKLQFINLEKIISVKQVTIKSNVKIEPDLYPSAELIQVEFADSLEAISNEKILGPLTLSERECLNKSPWTFWRINNKLYFIITRAMIFGQEIPKIQATMNEKLK